MAPVRLIPDKFEYANEVKLGVFNQLVIDSGFPNKIVIDKDVSGIDLLQYFVWTNNFDRANLQNANFSNANLKFSSAFDANFANANFSNADLTGSIFQDANFDGAVLEGAVLDSVNLDCKNHPVCNN